MGGMFDFLIEKLIAAFHVILDFIKDCCQWVVDAIIYIFTDFCGDILSFVVSLLSSVFQNIPFEIPQLPADLWANADYFFPCSECVVGLMWLITLWLSVLVIKIVLKIIPTIY